MRVENGESSGESLGVCRGRVVLIEPFVRRLHAMMHIRVRHADVV